MTALLLFLILQTTSAPTTQRADVPAPKTGPTTQIVERFHERHDRFVEQAKAGGIDLLFLGDSITEGWFHNGREVWEDRFAPHSAAAFGISGDRTQHLLWRITNGELDGITPRVVVLLIGTNNIPMRGEPDPPGEVAAGIAKIVSVIREKTGAKVLLLGIFPRGHLAEDAREIRSTIAEVNARIARLDDGQNVRYLDLTEHFLQPDRSISKEVMPDGLHLSPRGYHIWADGIEELLRAMVE
jgi:lysophospholipase L1-like esterase